MRIAQIIDTREYVAGNFWQSQLSASLDVNMPRDVFSLDEFIANFKPENYDVVLSTLKLRTIFKNAFRIAEVLKRTPIYVYEQDPWETFADFASFRGSYDHVSNVMNVRSFVVTSRWWRDYIREHGFACEFVPMWVNPSSCNYGLHFFDRWGPNPIFMGTLHDHRARLIERLSSLDVKIDVEPSRDFQTFVSILRRFKFFFHPEDEAGWSVDGRMVPQNALWGKEIEIAANGCFVIRKREVEASAYEIPGNIPCVLMYDDLSEIPKLIESVNDLTANEIRALQKRSVDFIRSHKGFGLLADIVRKET